MSLMDKVMGLGVGFVPSKMSLLKLGEVGF